MPRTYKKSAKYKIRRIHSDKVEMNSADFADFRAKCLVKSMERFASNLIFGLRHISYIPGNDLSC